MITCWCGCNRWTMIDKGVLHTVDEEVPLHHVQLDLRNPELNKGWLCSKGHPALGTLRHSLNTKYPYIQTTMGV